MDRRCPAIIGKNQQHKENFVRPLDFGFDELDRIQADTSITAKDTLEYNLKALQDPTSEAFQTIAYQACCILTHLSLMNTDEILDKINSERFNKDFLSCWENY